MEAISRLRWIATAGLLVSLAGVGCKTNPDRSHVTVFSGHTKAMPVVNPDGELVATWSNRIIHSPDPTRGGATAPGIAGRLYYFGPGIEVPMPMMGTVKVSLYDHSPKRETAEPKLLEEWNFDTITLKKLERPDAFGVGYTLFLPWATYRPDVSKVHLQVRHDCGDGTGQMAPGSTLTLEHNATGTIWQAGGTQPNPAANPASEAKPNPSRGNTLESVPLPPPRKQDGALFQESGLRPIGG